MKQDIKKIKKRDSYGTFVGLFVGIIIAVLVVFIFARHLWESLGQPPSAVNPDDVVFTVLPNGNRLVDDKTGGYSFTLPANWFFEKKEGSGVAVYPDYPPAGGDTPAKCKIEISVFKNIAATDMNDWATRHIHEDPTVMIAESLRRALSVNGATDAFEWKGSIDGIATTIVYVSVGGNVYEIVPSVLDIRKADDNILCDATLTEFLNGMRF